MTNKIAAIYNDNGQFENGVPARDLTVDEWAAIPEETRTRLVKSGMYTLPISDQKAPKKKDGE